MTQTTAEVGTTPGVGSTVGPPPGLEEQLREFVRETFLFGGTGTPMDRDYSFLEHGILDSMGVLELVAFLERTFAIDVHDEEIVPDNLDSIRLIAAFVQRKSGA